ncbi:hypothetical protein [Halorhodospira halophila]|uniref:Transmembrane protein n=1 Tax=Halorhodospira halophila (strain DSM 244 / SL1) TaxID=349124 RepID=A1WU88_HALHL|nr:hypothetical protein [Halorhodospira halophila]ABM61250.1 conserved hypothetical protein [Halorhodospira halophila SL1]MBK1730018.1 hypothetical protein [Halorhodospira halophila]
MIALILATLRDATSLLLRGLLVVTLPLIALILLALQGTGAVYAELAELAFPLRLALSAWVAGVAVAGVIALGTLLTAAQSGLPRTHYLAGFWRLVRLWIVQAVWLIPAALLIAAVAALLGDAVRAPVAEYADLRAAAPWTTAPALEIATGLVLHTAMLTISATWLWPPVVLLRSDGRIREGRPIARRMLQRIASLEWFLVLMLIPVLAVSLLYPPAGLLGVLLIVLCPAVTVVAIQRSSDAFRHATSGRFPIVWR